MPKLAVFYHCAISGPRIPSPTYAESVVCEQMAALKASGLAEVAEGILVGVNGGDGDLLEVMPMIPLKALVYTQGRQGESEIPTLDMLRGWLPGHEDWFVLYHHSKGVSCPADNIKERWRARMERVCVWDWKYCVASLIAGFDSVGCHWLTKDNFSGRVKTPYWGGNFWWATAKFLLTLPPLPPDSHANRYAAESWIGSGPRIPKVKDYYPGWPA
jgi:hypothetical protein